VDSVTDPQTQWARLLLQSLVDAGVREAIISPGSRSTPLVWAATHTPGLRCHSLIDERSAAFYALGQARITGLPSLLICTSGTAPSNYFPAVIEARESGVPLIVLSADRPFEAQHVGAHQTIDQTRLYGAYAPYHELGTPVADREALLGLRRTAWQVVSHSLEAPRGAVHLNFRARKPLEPSATAALDLPELGPRAAITRSCRPPSDADVELLIRELEACECPVLICGAASLHDSPSPELVWRFAELSGAVVCAESVSQLRFRAGARAGAALVCDCYDWLLAEPALAPLLAPDFALQLGATPVSAALERLVSNRGGSLRYAICAESGWPDPLHQSAALLKASPSLLLEAACEALARRPRVVRPRLALWREAQTQVRAELDRLLASGFGEAAAVVTACALVPEGSVLAIGNSLPPRLLDRYAPASERDVTICCQRGASGIEGAVAGALGAATQTDSPVTLLVGDISFLHDIGSLWAASPERTLAGTRSQPIVIIVLNNAGGRIFEQLPIAAHPDVALERWTTPHQMSFGAAASLYGLEYSAVTERGTFERALREAYSGQAVTLIEVRVEPGGALDSQRQASAELAPLLARVARGWA
jgi:2-succinyl-5-enolpyruvyl-6-hydroxy-3-cyclohexene-1-carboxylate synthase